MAASCVSLYRPGEAEALESLPITQICSYGVSDSNTFTITATDRHLLFHTSEVKSPHRGPAQAKIDVYLFIYTFIYVFPESCLGAIQMFELT